jgi:hypothetical protein
VTETLPRTGFLISYRLYFQFPIGSLCEDGYHRKILLPLQAEIPRMPDLLTLAELAYR